MRPNVELTTSNTVFRRIMLCGSTGVQTPLTIWRGILAGSTPPVPSGFRLIANLRSITVPGVPLQVRLPGGNHERL